MDTNALLRDFQDRIEVLLRAGPAVDLERNLKALLAQAFQRVDLVTRDEYDALAQALAGLRARVEALEAALAAAESGDRIARAPESPPAG